MLLCCLYSDQERKSTFNDLNSNFVLCLFANFPIFFDCLNCDNFCFD